MDVSYFAVDKCGHVGLFHSGLEAAVPKRELFQWGSGAMASHEGALKPGDMKTMIEGGFLPVGKHQTKTKSEDETYGAWLIRPDAVADLTVAMALMLPGRTDWGFFGPFYKPRFEKIDGYVFLLGAIPKSFIDLVHTERGRCRGCWEGPCYGYKGRSELFGIFEYSENSQETGPYCRGFVPKKPRLIDDIRESVKIPKKIPTFPFCFKTKLLIQPIQWIPVSVYGSPQTQLWKTEDGKKRTGVKGASECGYA
jgi:hypothetical protein